MTPEIWKIFWSNYQLKGYSLYQAAKSINFLESTMRKWVERVGDSREGTILELAIRGRTAPGLIMANHSQFIENLLESRSEYTLDEISLLLQEEFPEDFESRLSISAVHKHLISKLNFTLKKAEIYSERRNHEEIRQKRSDYVNKIVTEERVHYGQNCVFVDETGFNLHINRTQARARRNEPARIVVPSSSKGRNVTIFGAISHRGAELLAKHNTDNTTRSNNFLDFIDGLIEHLDSIGAQGSYVVYDSAPIHGTAAAQKLEAADYNPLKLPPWSSFLNLIEECFSKLKNGVKKHKLHNSLTC